MSPRLALVVIASLFILPLALAWLMYSGVIDYDPVETRNLGELVEPPVPVSFDALEWHGPENFGESSLEGHWVILYALPVPCGETCLEDATSLRQVHRAAGRNQSRLRLLLLGDTTPEIDEGLEMISVEFHRAKDRGRLLAPELDRIASGQGAGVAGSVYLIDPLGNIMLFYAAGFDPNDLKKDLKRLLTWSKLDEN
jgi:cytochrome oxidase Cu insertion factor (SCO1/SenC/PrrC family)